MATTMLLTLASVILENEKKWHDAAVQAQYVKSESAKEAASQNADDFALQVMSVLESDRLSSICEKRDLEMNSLVQETREYLSKV